jgi:hypothetical protein
MRIKLLALGILLVMFVMISAQSSCTPSPQAQASCKDWLLLKGKTTSGVYSIDPDGSGAGAPFDVYCDMVTDGGGWTLILKTLANSDVFKYQATYWSTTALLNETTPSIDSGDAKYQPYNVMPFSYIRGCVATATANCVSYNFAEPKTTALDLFNGPQLYEGVVRDEFYAVFHPTGMRDCVAQRPGFNVQANDNNWYRWGFANNIPSQVCQTSNTDDADGVIGFGLTGQDCGATGAGWTNYFVNDTSCGGHQQSFDSWIWIR